MDLAEAQAGLTRRGAAEVHDGNAAMVGRNTQVNGGAAGDGAVSRARR